MDLVRYTWVVLVDKQLDCLEESSPLVTIWPIPCSAKVRMCMRYIVIMLV